MRCFLVETMRPQNILQPQQLHVGSKGHLSRAIGVKIELVLDNLGEMSFDFMAFFESFAIETFSLESPSTLGLKPHTLHLI